MKYKSLFLCLLSAQSIIAGNDITGTIVEDKDGLALEGVAVQLMTADSTLVNGTNSGKNGKFRFSDIANGNYQLRFSFLGYKPSTLEIRNLDKNQNLGEIRLAEASTMLEELEVKGDAVIHKIDRQIILPTAGQIKASQNGIALLQYLQLPNIAINPLDKSVETTYGDAVQLRINGVEATKDEIMAIRPADVLRIEYHDNPGLRYGNAVAVLDYIVRRKDSGGNVSADLTNGISPLGYGEYNISAKYNRKKSSFNTILSWERRDLKWNRENYEWFNYPDKQLFNEETGMPTKIKYDYINFSISYSYANGDKNMLNVTFRNNHNNTPNSFSDRNSTLFQDGKGYKISDHLKNKENIPSLDIYYQHKFKNGKHLYADVVGTYLNSNSSHTYAMAEDEVAPIEIYSCTDGSKYSAIGEIIYEQPLWKGLLTAGLKHAQSYTSNKYEGTVNGKTGMAAAESYLFAEYRASIKKLNYSIGIGGMRTYHSQGNLQQEKYILSPTISLSYNATDNIFLRYNANMSGYSPSLSALSDISQEIDAYQLRRGNPELESVTYFSNSLSASWRSRYVNVELFGRYSFDSKPIMEETLFEAGKFVRTSANQDGFHRLQLQANVQVLPWKQFLSIRLTPFFNRYVSYGNNYTHTHSNTGFRGSLIGMYKNWAIMVEMNTSYHDLWGETITKGEKLHTIALGYNKEKWSVQAMAMNPFSKKYEQEIVNLSQLAPNKQLAYSTDLCSMFMINVAFNLDFGKQRNSGGKRINNSDTDTGILSGSK